MTNVQPKQRHKKFKNLGFKYEFSVYYKGQLLIYEKDIHTILVNFD